MKNYDKISSNLEKYCKRLPIFETSRYSVDQFEYPQSIYNWLQNHTQDRTLILVGNSDYGKTQGIIALLNSLQHKILRVTGINYLKKFNSSAHTAILFDDFNWLFTDRTTRLALFDKDVSSDIRVLYGVATITVQLKKVPSNFLIIKIVLIKR